MRERWLPRGDGYFAVFMLGACWDAVLSMDVIVTSQFSLVGVFITTMLSTLLPYMAFDRVRSGMELDWKKIWVLALGSAVGADTVVLIWKLTSQ
jgi:hypothetical protein